MSPDERVGNAYLVIFVGLPVAVVGAVALIGYALYKLAGG